MIDGLIILMTGAFALVAVLVVGFAVWALFDLERNSKAARKKRQKHLSDPECACRGCELRRFMFMMEHYAEEQAKEAEMIARSKETKND